MFYDETWRREFEEKTQRWAAADLSQRLDILRQDYDQSIQRANLRTHTERIHWHASFLTEQIGHLNGFLVLKDFNLPSLREYTEGNVFLGGLVLAAALRECLQDSPAATSHIIDAVNSLCDYFAAVVVVRETDAIPSVQQVHWLLFSAALLIGAELGVPSIMDTKESDYGGDALKRASLAGSGLPDVIARLNAETWTLLHNGRSECKPST